MRYLFSLLILFSFIACEKSNDDTDDEVTDNTIEPNDKTNSFIHVNYDYSPGGTFPGAYLDLNFTEAHPALGWYSTATSITTSVYKSWVGGINMFPGPSVCPNRFFTVPGISHVYVDLRNINHQFSGSLNTSLSKFELDGGGKITYGPNSFLYNYEDVWFTYINPAEKKYVMSTPDVTVDLDGKRWFLKSYGELYMTLPRYKLPGDPVYVEYPIPATLLSEAPDSVQTWLFSITDDKWVPKGWAVKAGNAYKFRATEAGIWNIAKKVKGLLKTIEFTTDQGAPVINAIIRVTGNTRELASERTNPAGHALCYLPTGENMTAEVLFDWSTSTNAFTLPIAAFENNSIIKLVVPTASPNVATISGTMKTCSGATITGGQIRLVASSAPILQGHIVFSSVNGTYKAAVIYDNPLAGYTASPLDVVANFTGKDTSFIIKTGQNNVVNFTTCQ